MIERYRISQSVCILIFKTENKEKELIAGFQFDSFPFPMGRDPKVNLAEELMKA